VNPPLDVADNDEVTFYYNVSWSDTRPSRSPSEVHSFHMWAGWNATHLFPKWYNVTTTGGASGSAQINVTVWPVLEIYTLGVLWEITLSGTCTAYAEEFEEVLLY